MQCSQLFYTCLILQQIENLPGLRPSLNSDVSLCFSLICIFSQYKIVNGNYRDSDSLRVINKLWLNVNSDNTFEVSKTCTFCWETSIGNAFYFFLNKYLIPGLKVTELQQSHYTIHLQSEIAPSGPDHLLVTTLAWGRLLLSRLSTFGICFSVLLQSNLMWFSFLHSLSVPHP